LILSVQVADFDAALIASVDEAIRLIFSQQVVDTLHSNLKDTRTISLDQISNQLPTLSLVLKKYFGLGAPTVEKAIGRSLYSRLNFDFQSKEGYKLTDYVEDARRKLRSTSPTSTPTSGTLPLDEDFDRLLLEAVRETFEDVLGKDSAKSALRILDRDFRFDELPRHLPSFYSALDRMFGNDRGRIETAIARTLYKKLYLEFTESPNSQLSSYIESALLNLKRRETTSFHTFQRGTAP
jgi:hypothetical protein